MEVYLLFGQGLHLETAGQKPKKAIQSRQDPHTSLDNLRPQGRSALPVAEGESEAIRGEQTSREDQVHDLEDDFGDQLHAEQRRYRHFDDRRGRLNAMILLLTKKTPIPVVKEQKQRQNRSIMVSNDWIGLLQV
jgi:hypothetical protein